MASGIELKPGNFTRGSSLIKASLPDTILNYD